MCSLHVDFQAEIPTKQKMSIKVDQELTPERLMQLASAYQPPLIIGAAVSNKVFDTLANGARNAEQLSQDTGASVRGLRAILNALVGLELLKKNGDKYSLTPESEAFLVSNKPGTLAGFFPMNMKRLIPLWLKLDDIVRTGEPAEARNTEQPGTEECCPDCPSPPQAPIAGPEKDKNDAPCCGRREARKPPAFAPGQDRWSQPPSATPP